MNDQQIWTQSYITHQQQPYFYEHGSLFQDIRKKNHRW